MSSWNDLASSERWHGVVTFIRGWVGPFDSCHGMKPEELDELLREESPHLPPAVREWYILAGNWNQNGLNFWIRPEHLKVEEDVIVVLTDTEGINQWSIRATDLYLEDPPVVSLDTRPHSVICSHFSEFVAAMVINDYLFTDEATGEPIKFNRDYARATLMCLFPSFDAFLADAPLESATIVAFVYPNHAAYGKARTPEGRALLDRLQ